MTRIILGEMVSFWSPKYSWATQAARSIVRQKCEKLMAKGFDVKFESKDEGQLRVFYIEFENDYDAVMFKLTVDQ